MQRILLCSGQFLCRTDLNSVMNMYREERKIVILSHFGESVVVITRDDILSLLKSKVIRKQRERKLVPRYIDSDILIALRSMISFPADRNSLQNSSADKEEGETNDFCNVTHNKNLKRKQTSGHNEKSTLSPVLPRRPNTTTVVGIEFVAFPDESQIYNKPKYQDIKENECILTEDNHLTQGLAPCFSYNRRATNNHSVIASGTGTPFHVKPAKYPNYVEKQKRENSFNTTKWQVDDKPDYLLLVKYGLFFTGNNDLVRCYQCGVGLEDWVKEDDVLNEHVQHSPSCDFLIQMFGKIKIDQMKVALTAKDNSKKDSSASNASDLPYKIHTTRYQTTESRVASFAEFPRHIKLPPQQLAVAGLFFTGNGDLCRCFTCDGILKDWSSVDDPIKKHATYFPECAYINQLKGPDYVKLQQQNGPRNEPVGAANAACDSMTITQPKQTSTALQMNQLSISNEYSSFNVSQVVQQLGYAEVDVIRAKEELQRKGDKFPTADEIVNTLLDMQERTEHVPTAAVLKASPENKSDDEQYKKPLIKCTRKLVEKMSPGVLLDQLLESRFLTFVETRDIQELQLTSDKNRAILQKVMMKGKRGYMEFKDCLRKCNQGHLADLLEREEN